MSKWLTEKMVEHGIIEKDEQEIYQYGIRNGLIILLNLVTTFLIGAFTDRLALVFVFTLFFMTLRSYTGGYHSDSRILCYIGSSLLLFIPIYTQNLFNMMPGVVVILTLATAVVIILILSPMHSKNRKLDEEEQKHFGAKARIIVLIQTTVFCILWHLDIPAYAYAIYSNICMTAIFMLIGKIQLQIQKNMEEE